jgi:hypothetical protein
MIMTLASLLHFPFVNRVRPVFLVLLVLVLPRRVLAGLIHLRAQLPV